MSAPDSATLWLGFAGLVGAGLRVILTTDQETVSKKSVGDLVIGFLVGSLWTLYPLIPFPESASLLQKALIIGGVAYIAGDALGSIFSRMTGWLKSMQGGATPTAPTP